jgi:hypothetical protein
LGFDITIIGFERIRDKRVLGKFGQQVDYRTVNI